MIAHRTDRAASFLTKPIPYTKLNLPGYRTSIDQGPARGAATRTGRTAKSCLAHVDFSYDHSS